ncbi:nuclear transport factor 2 family protein [Streptomyces sp. DSM 44917]|uniref:Nuclear transport factor 2 family protein n=1 Tax=Streptomyces boetiae TaxID=3075541 RepID=A0ABU2LD39_9ACTN|nr:nuclear transport factor 2 family protein [Streptomyces sp. DSM 44917]MDT0309482.1 nuclear transport factor 2 family protein [Streptomyces sp. DSM 44917]
MTTTTTDHEAIAQLISRFFRFMDERRFAGAWAADYFTEDIRMEAPAATAEDAATAQRLVTEALERFARTQHISADVLTRVDTAAGTATASWNALMTHIHPEGAAAQGAFTVGGHCTADLRRTPEGWRFRSLSIAPVWTTGTPPVLPSPVR